MASVKKTLGTPRPVAHDELTDVAHDELTDVAMHCVHSFIGPKACVTGRHGPWAEALAAPLSQWLCLCATHLRPGITLPINDSIIDSNFSGTWELGRFCALFGPKESGDKPGGVEFGCFPG